MPFHAIYHRPSRPYNCRMKREGGAWDRRGCTKATKERDEKEELVRAFVRERMSGEDRGGRSFELVGILFQGGQV